MFVKHALSCGMRHCLWSKKINANKVEVCFLAFCCFYFVDHALKLSRGNLQKLVVDKKHVLRLVLLSIFWQ